MKSAKYRRQEALFPAEGVRLCRDALISGTRIAQFFYTAQAAEKYPDVIERLCLTASKTAEVSPALMDAMCDTRSPQGILCLCQMLDKSSDCVYKRNTGGRILALENIQDPSNLGTVLRTAEALGISGVLLSSGCCDLYSPKVLRGSMGAVFRIPFTITEHFTDALQEMKYLGYSVYAAVPARDALPVTGLSFPQKCAAVIGNEGNGLTQEAIAACTDRVTIPMSGRAESLNAAIASSIFMWEMMRGNFREAGCSDE